MQIRKLSLALGLPLLAAALLLGRSLFDSGAAAPPGSFQFNDEKILGTSLALTIRGGSEAQAQAAHAACLAEIDRLAKILSRWDPQSELARLNASDAPLAASPELVDVLNLCESWRKRSGGAFNALVGKVETVWQAAVKDQRLPEAATLAAAAQAIQAPGWTVGPDARTVRRSGGESIDVDGLAKGWIIQKAMSQVRQADPAANGALLDIGGDILCWSQDEKSPWTVSIADPAHPEENAKPLAVLSVANASVCGSGGYGGRGYEIGGKTYSHIIDPRTGQPLAERRSATAIALDAADADAMATILCVLPAADGLKLVAQTLNTECLIVDADGTQHPSAGWAKYLASAPPADTTATQPPAGTSVAAAAPPSTAWPKGAELQVAIDLLGAPANGGQPQGRGGRGGRGGFKRQYLAIWIEGPDGKYVRTLAMLGTEWRYARELRSWTSAIGNNQRVFDAVARATRRAGHYVFAWDGLDDAGKPLPLGKYNVKIDVSREHGNRFVMSGAIDCGATTATQKLADNTEISGATLEYRTQPR